MVVARPTRTRDSLQAHYTASTPIVSYMVSRLAATEDDEIWEPCAGGGDLIDGVLSVAPQASIRASEIDLDAANKLSEKFKSTTLVDVRNEDALEIGVASLFEPIVSFSRIIANPPYGAYQSPKRRQQLQSRFAHLYVKETYGVILFHSLSLLRRHGRLVFIIPDTFLWLTRHEHLRRTLLTQTTIEEIALFPSKFFPNVNFGYSGLCIVTVTKDQPESNHMIRVLNDFSNVEELSQCVDSPETSWKCKVSMLNQSEIVSRAHSEFVLGNGGAGVRIGTHTTATLGDYADIKTGFYSGNDRRWVRRRDETVPRAKAFTNVCSSEVSTIQPTLKGFAGVKVYIPIVRGGASPYVKPTQWFVDWSCSAIAEYTRKGDNPARFQNSSYYFRDGIAVPMVASGRITGALLEHRLFDQSIVGIFPHDPTMLLFILGFFNSSIATELVHQINPTANNSANYLKRVPIVLPSRAELNHFNPIILEAIEEARQHGLISPDLQARIDSLYSELWLHSEGTG